MTNGHPNFPVLILLGARASPVTANSSPRNVIVIPLTISAEPEVSPNANTRLNSGAKMVTPVLNAGVDLSPGHILRPHRKASVINGVGDGALTDADFRGCRWIEGDPTPSRRGMFCGSPVASGESWCAKHRRVVFW